MTWLKDLCIRTATDGVLRDIAVNVAKTTKDVGNQGRHVSIVYKFFRSFGGAIKSQIG